MLGLCESDWQIDSNFLPNWLDTRYIIPPNSCSFPELFPESLEGRALETRLQHIVALVYVSYAGGG